MTLVDNFPLATAAAAEALDAAPRIVFQRGPGECLHDSTLTVLNHIANAPDGVGMDALFAVFVHAKGALRGATATRQNLINVLAEQVRRGRLLRTGSQRASLWRANPDWRPGMTTRTRNLAQCQIETQSDAVPTPPPAPACILGNPVVAPRQFSVLHGPLYVPPVAPPVRAGSQDFKALASRGWRC